MPSTAFICEVGNHIVKHPQDRYVVAMEARRLDGMHRLFRIHYMDMCRTHAEEFEAERRTTKPVVMDGQESML